MIAATERTPIKLERLPGLVAAGYQGAFGAPPSDTARRMGVCQLIAEHGRKDHDPTGPLWNIFCDNAGNQDAAHEDLQPSPEESPVLLFRTVPECEGSACRRRAQHLRRAFATPEDGIAAYWTRLSVAYPGALAGADVGAEEFVHGLCAGRYFTALPTQYLALMQALLLEAKRKSW